MKACSHKPWGVHSLMKTSRHALTSHGPTSRHDLTSHGGSTLTDAALFLVPTAFLLSLHADGVVEQVAHAFGQGCSRDPSPAPQLPVFDFAPHAQPRYKVCVLPCRVQLCRHDAEHSRLVPSRAFARRGAKTSKDRVPSELRCTLLSAPLHVCLLRVCTHARANVCIGLYRCACAERGAGVIPTTCGAGKLLCTHLQATSRAQLLATLRAQLLATVHAQLLATLRAQLQPCVSGNAG